jgi:uncharacterized protein YebE (UPF0316 family)
MSAINQVALGNLPLLPVVIFFARVVDVSIGTVRLICVTRGHRWLAVVLAFFEVSIWVFAISRVLAHLDRWENLLAFAAGFAAGNAVGMWIEDRLALGAQILSFISRGPAHAVAERLRFADLSVTTLTGSGRDGPVSIATTVVPRRTTPAVIRMAREVDPDAVVTVEDVRQTSAIGHSGNAPGKIPLLLNRSRRLAGGT